MVVVADGQQLRVRSFVSCFIFVSIKYLAITTVYLLSLQQSQSVLRRENRHFCVLCHFRFAHQRVCVVIIDLNLEQHTMGSVYMCGGNSGVYISLFPCWKCFYCILCFVKNSMKHSMKLKMMIQQKNKLFPTLSKLSGVIVGCIIVWLQLICLFADDSDMSQQRSEHRKYFYTFCLSVLSTCSSKNTIKCLRKLFFMEANSKKNTENFRPSCSRERSTLYRRHFRHGCCVLLLLIDAWAKEICANNSSSPS